MDFNNDTSVLSNVAVISSSTDTVTLQGTGGLVLPSGITAERPTFANGVARYNSTTGFVEISSNGSWVNITNAAGSLPTGGNAGDVLLKNSSTNYDVSFGPITADMAPHAKQLVAFVKNDTASTITKGTPVYQVGNEGSSWTILVRPADAADPAKMPAIGVLEQDLAPAATGYVVILGEIRDINTSGAIAGAAVYVAAGSGYTTTKPSNVNHAVQFLGFVTKIHATNGGMEITGTGAIDIFKDGNSEFFGWDGTTWIKLSTGGSSLSGNGLSLSGNTINFNQGAGLTINGSNVVDLDLYPSAGLMLTTDGTTISSNAAAQLSLTKIGTAGTYRSVTVDSYGRVSAGTNPTTLSGYGITDAQPLNSNLTSLTTLVGTGIITKTGVSSFGIDSNIYLTQNQTITLTGDVTGTGTNSIATTLATITDTGVGSFKKVTVNTKGLVTGTANVTQSDITGLLGAGSISNVMIANGAVSNLTGVNTGDQTITLTGDVTGSGTGTFSTTLSNSGVTAGTYNNSATAITPFTVDAKGRVTLTGNSVTITPAFSSITSKPTTLTGYGITDAAPISSSYIVVSNDSTLANERALSGTTNQIAITDNGVNSTIAVGIASNPIIPGTGAITVPQGTTAQRPTNSTGLLRFNSNIGQMEYNNGTIWQSLSSTVGTVTTIGLSAPSEFIVGGSPVTNSGTLTLTKATQVAKTVYAGPTSGADAQPTFRTLSLGNDLSDVVLSSPTNGQNLYYDGTKWVNFGTIGGPTGGGAGKRIWSANIAAQSGTSIIVPGASPPLITDGTQLWTLTINPWSTDATYVIQTSIACAGTTNNTFITTALFRGSTYVGGTMQIVQSSNNSATLSFSVTDKPNTTGSVTYSVRIGISTSSTWYVNRRSSEITYGGLQTGLVMWEY